MAAGFMAGFGTNFAKLMEEDRQYFREQAAKKKDYIQTYGTRAVTDREDKANSVMAVVNNLQTRGFKPSTVRYVLDNNGITGLMELQDTAAKRTDITKDEIDSIVTKAADYVSKNPDEDMQTVIRRAFGLYKSEANPVKRDRNAFSAILGFDNAMLEDEVLDDMYINGYTGRDIYRIMGSAGPRAGAALQLDLPTEPLSPTAQKLYADVMLDQMEAGIDSRITLLKTEMTQEGADKQALQGRINALETIKGRGLEGLTDYANKYDPSIYTYARSLEEDKAGSITSNSILLSFREAFNDRFEGKKPEVKTKSAQGLTDDDLGLPNEPTVITFNSQEEAIAAAEKGEISKDQLVKIGKDGPTFKLNMGPSYKPIDTSMTDTSSLGGVADASGMSVEDINASKADKARRKTQESAEAIGGASGTVADWFDRNILGRSVGSFNDLASTITSGFAWGFDQAGLEGLADGLYTAAYDMSEGAENMRKMGFFENALNSVQSGEYTESEWIEAAAEFIVENMPDQPGKPTVKDIIEGKEKGAKIKEVLASSYDSIVNLEGVPAIPQNLEIPKRSTWTPTSQPVDENGRMLRTDDILFDTLVYDRQNEPYPDSYYIDDGYTQEQLDRVKKEVDAAFKRSDLDAALDRAPDHIEKLGDQATDAWRKLTAEVKDFSLSDISLSTPDEDNPMLTFVEGLVGEQTTEVSEEKPANVATRASDTPAYKQLQELLQERIALANRPPKDKKKKEETIKKKAEKILIDLGDMSGAPGFRTEEVSLLSLILADKLPERIVEYNPRAIGTVGSRDLGLRDTTDDVRPPRGEAPDRAASLARGPSPEGDDLPAEMPRNMAVENFTTRGINATPRGLMTPNRESAPKLGQAEFGDLIQRVHGSSKAAEAFNKKVSSGKLTAADVTRLLKATRKLPETASRQRLIASLFNLRDGLNKR